jgi:trimeric autotransporter adhesin
MRGLRRHLSFANLASGLALLLALTTSGAWAASQLGAKSVGERQLRPGAVTAQKLRKGAVSSPKLAAEAVVAAKLANAAVSEQKLANAAVSSAKLKDGSVGTDKLADEAVTGAKVNESTLSQVPSAAQAETATFAEAANPAAFASVAKGGSFDPEASRGIVSVKQPEAGLYCIAAELTPRGALVTPKLATAAPLGAYARLGGGPSPCAFTEVEVQIRDGAGKPAETPFFALLYR